MSAPGMARLVFFNKMAPTLHDISLEFVSPYRKIIQDLLHNKNRNLIYPVYCRSKIHLPKGFRIFFRLYYLFPTSEIFPACKLILSP